MLIKRLINKTCTCLNIFDVCRKDLIYLSIGTEMVTPSMSHPSYFGNAEVPQRGDDKTHNEPVVHRLGLVSLELDEEPTIPSYGLCLQIRVSLLLKMASMSNAYYAASDCE